MKRLATVITAMGLSLFATHASAAAGCSAAPNANALATEVAAGLNANRQAQGLAPLAFNPVLGQAAMRHACDMSVNGFFGHSGSDGSSVQRRVRTQGYRDCIVAENLAWGYPNAGQIVSGWMTSAGHRSNMLHPRVAEFGIAVTQGARGPNWVLVLANDCVIRFKFQEI